MSRDKSDIETLKARGSWHTARKYEAAAQTHPEPPEAVPEPPSWLTAGALALWYEHASTIHELGALGLLDVIAMGQLFTAMDEHQEAATTVAREGSVISKEHYTGPHPLIKARDDASKRVATLMRVTGLTRTGRTGMTLSPPKKQDAPGFAKPSLFAKG